jgi:hypothetical protein
MAGLADDRKRLITIPAAGTPQLFQTGESYQLVPLVNAHHPHDLLKGLGVNYRIGRSEP